MIKFFECKKGIDLEKKINEWITTHQNLDIIDIKYQVLIDENEVWHFGIIFFKE